MIASRKPRPPLDFALRPTRLLFAPTDLGTHADLCDDPVAWLAPDDILDLRSHMLVGGHYKKVSGFSSGAGFRLGTLARDERTDASSSILRTTHSSRRWVTEVSERGRR